MTCAPTDRLLQTLRVMIPGAGDDMLNLQIFNTIDVFLRRTNAWKIENDIILNGDELEYDLGVPGDAAIVRVMSAEHRNIPIANTQSGVVQSSFGTLVPELTFPDGDAIFDPVSMGETAPGIFTWAIYRPNYISFTGVPDEEGRKFPFKLVISLSLAKHCLEVECSEWDVPEWMYDTYFDDWKTGVLSELYGMPAKPWSNPALGMFHGKKFRSQMGFRKQEVARGFAYNVPRWRFPRGGW